MAEESLTKAIGVFRSLQQEADGEDYMASIAACYNYMGDIYRAQERYDEALRNYNEGVRIGQGTAATNGLAQIYSNIGQVKYQQKRYAESYIYLDKARESLEKNGYRWGLERTEGYLALVCLATDKVSEARMHLEKAKTISEKIGNPVTQRVIAQAEEKLS
jgi:tetratricopeptide (TPR) repeat protein